MRDGREGRIVGFPGSRGPGGGGGGGAGGTRRGTGRRLGWRWRWRRLPAGVSPGPEPVRVHELGALRLAVEAAARRRVDVVVERERLEVDVDDGGPLVRAELPEPVLGSRKLVARLTPWAASQLARHVAIPEGYARRTLLHAPDLWAASVNRWLRPPRPGRPGPGRSPLLLRLRSPEETDGEPEVRAVLSNAYRILDSLEVLDELEEALARWVEDLALVDAETDGDGLWVRLAWRRPEHTVEVGDAVQAGVAVHNSEVGDGALEVRSWLLRLVCTNGMVIPKRGGGLRRVHRGARRPPGRCRPERWPAGRRPGEGLCEALGNALDPAVLDGFLDAAGRARRIVVRHPVPALARLVERRLVTSRERVRMVERVERVAREPSLWQFANVITAVARERPPARRWALERLGGELLEPGPLQELVLDP